MRDEPTDTNSSDSEFRLLIVRYLDDTLDASDYQRFNSFLRSDNNYRLTFAEVCRIRAGLIEQFRQGHPFKGALDWWTEKDLKTQRHVDLNETLFGTAIPSPQAEPRPIAPMIEASPIAKLPTVQPVRRGGRAAMIFLPLLITGIAWFALQHRKPLATATLISSVAAKWDSSTISVGQPLPLKQICLRHGFAQINLSTGTHVVVEGPAVFKVASAGEIDLLSGRMTVHVPPEAHGFCVQLRNSKVVDLGTEFGVGIDDDGSDAVEVFKGNVVFNATVGSQSSPFGRRLVTGDTMRVSKRGEFLPLPPGAVATNAFVRVDQYEHWTASKTARASTPAVAAREAFYDQLAQDPSLALLFVLDDADRLQNKLHNHATAAAGKYSVTLAADAPSWATDGGLDFDPKKHQWFGMKPGPVSTTGQLSGAFWVKARSRPVWASIAKSWSDNARVTGQIHFGLGNRKDDLEIGLGHDRNSAAVTISEGEDHPFPLDRWVNVAFSTDGKRVTLYRDGAKVASGAANEIPTSPAITTMSIGCKTADNNLAPSIGTPGFWDGQIGTMAIFYRTLTPEEVSKMQSLGPP